MILRLKCSHCSLWVWPKQTDTTVNRGMSRPFWTWHCLNYIAEPLTFRRQHADATWHGVQCKGFSFFALLTLRLDNFTAINTVLYAAFVYIYWTSQKVYECWYILILTHTHAHTHTHTHTLLTYFLKLFNLTLKLFMLRFTQAHFCYLKFYSLQNITL